MIRNWLTHNRFLVRIVCILGVGTTQGWAQPDIPPKPLSIGAQAAGVVLKHYTFNPAALDPKTDKPLTSKGSWSVSKETPASCPQTKETCVEVFYEFPDESVRCSWVVLLNADGSDGKFLEENDDAERYMLLTATKSEAKALVVTRKKPVFPPIAAAVGTSGAVVVNVLVGKTGEPQKFGVVSGPPIVQYAAMDAAKSWKFKPMLVGARAVPYAIQLTFTFQTVNPSFTKVDVAP